MSSKRKPVIKFKQRIIPDLKINNATPLNPPTHKSENLTIVQGSGRQINAQQMIVDKKDVNSY